MSFEIVFKKIHELKKSAASLRQMSSKDKNTLLNGIAKALLTRSEEILQANRLDVERLPSDTLESFRDRLTLNPARLRQMADSLEAVAKLDDPVGEVVDERILKNGLKVQRVRAPLGCILMVFESRPNVITEAFSLAFKAGNVIALRGGKESSNSAAVIYAIIYDEFKRAKIDAVPVYGLDEYSRDLVEELLLRDDIFDIVVPRGGDALINFVKLTALMPIIKNDRGMCHAYVDESADLDIAMKIVVNGKTQRPGVCNALETVLVHDKVAKAFLPKLYQETKQWNLQFYCDRASISILPKDSRVEEATNENWNTEYLDFKINCKVVNSLEEAIQHIEHHGSKHSETIITSDESKAKKFLESLDSAVVYWNASTRFTDGFELGLGGELGISTQKLHVRGPVGLRELTTPRWVIRGTGQTRI